MTTDTLEKATKALAYFLSLGIQQKLESIRLARVGYALLISGCSTNGSFPGDKLSTYLVNNQRKDGGWSDVEETVWCFAYLNTCGKRYEREIIKVQKWLASVQLPCGAWGKNQRDQPRIPISALVASLVPNVVNSDSLNWLAQQWEADLNSPTQLTYKGGYFLLASGHSDANFDSELISRTIEYLIAEQEGDGGYSPWKGHPVGSDPWSTGIILWGLSQVQEKVPKETIEKALSWLFSKQLDNGLWPYHYLDDGTSMVLIGISSNLRFLKE